MSADNKNFIIGRHCPLLKHTGMSKLFTQWPHFCMSKVRLGQHQIFVKPDKALQKIINCHVFEYNSFAYDSMSRTYLPHILAVLTHCTYTIPSDGLEDLLKRHFPTSRFIKAFNMSNKAC